MIEPKGRMINRDISESKGFAKLSPEAAVLFCMLIPHFNSHGKQPGGPGHIKEVICPLVEYLTYEKIPLLLKEIGEKTGVKWYECEGRKWLHSLNFLKKHQRLDREKMGQDKIPGFSKDLFNTSIVQVQNNSDTSTKEVHIEDKVREGKDKIREKLPLDPSKTPPQKSLHQIITDHVHATYLKAKGFKYPFGPRDFKIIKWLATNYGDAATAIWDDFLAKNWDWKNGKKIPHTLANLEKNIGELLEAGDWKKRVAAPGGSFAAAAEEIKRI